MQDQELAFSEYVLQGFDLNRAYCLAFGSQNMIAAQRLANCKRMKHQLAIRQKQILNKLALNTDRVLTEVASIAMSNIKDVCEWDGSKVSVKSSGELTQEQAAGIKEISPTKEGVSLKMHDKLSALQVLLKSRDEDSEWYAETLEEVVDTLEETVGCLSSDQISAIRACLKDAEPDLVIRAYPGAENIRSTLERCCDLAKVHLSSVMWRHLTKGNLAVAEKMAKANPQKTAVTIQIEGEDEVQA